MIAQIAFADRAVALNPNSALGWMARGWTRIFADQTAGTEVNFERAIRLSPFDVMLFYFYMGMAAANFFEGRYEEALDWSYKSLQENPRYSAAVRMLAASCGQLGRVDEGKSAVARLLAENPGMTVESWRVRSVHKQPGVERFLDGLRKAGLPE
jgi:adenylate cyclase